MIDALFRDIRIAARGLRRNPGFTAVAVLTLALGIGATTAVFSVVYGVLFRPLPFPNADRLVEVIQVTLRRGEASPGRVGLTAEQITEWRATSRTLSQIPQQYSFASFVAPTYVVRTSDSSRALLQPVRDTVRRLDPNLVVYEATTMDALLARSFMDRQVYSVTSTGFAVVATLLAAIGLYSVLACSVGARTRELGIRIALGAQARALVANVMREAMAMVMLGIAAGLAGAVYLSRFLDKLLFGVTPQDPATLASVVVAFILVSMLAAYVPSRRATRVDPVVALRSE